MRLDRRIKSGLYARGGIPEYWILNLVDRVLEIHRDAMADQAASYGWRYGSVMTSTPPAEIAPVAFPSIRIAVADLLP